MRAYTVTHVRYDYDGGRQELLGAFATEQEARDRALKLAGPGFWDIAQIELATPDGVTAVAYLYRELDHEASATLRYVYRWGDSDEIAAVVDEPRPTPGPMDALYAEVFEQYIREWAATPTLASVLMKRDGFVTFSVEDKKS